MKSLPLVKLSTFIALSALAVPQTAFAHPGHIAESNGHTHWIAVAALAGVAVIGGWALAHKLAKRNAAKRDSSVLRASKKHDHA